MSFSRWAAWSPQHWFYDVSDILVRHVYERSEQAYRKGDAARDAITTPEQLQARQEYIREAFLRGIGGLPSSDTPLNPQITGTVKAEGFRIEKVIFEARPAQYVTANLYIPDGLTAPEAAVLFLCGHHKQAKHHPEYQSVCQHLVRAGLIVLAQDPVGQGERLGYYEAETGHTTVNWGTTEHDHAGAQCLPFGDCLARYFLHDALRGLDYLASRPEVDATRIGITGNSGGGTQTSLVLLAAADRIAAAAPTTFIMDRASYQKTGGAQDAEQIWPGFTAAGLDHEDILLSLCPKPVQVQAVTGDFFPIEGTRRTVARARRLWEMQGVEASFGLVEDQADHWYTTRLMQAAARFFALHLRGARVELESFVITPFPQEQLWCTKSGQVRGEIEGAGFTYEANLARATEIEAIREAVSSAEAFVLLRERVTANRVPGDLNPRFLFTDTAEGVTVQACLWRPQEDLFNLGYLFRSELPASGAVPVIIGIWDGGTREIAAHQEWIQERCAAGEAVLVLDTSGAGALLPRPLNAQSLNALYGTIHKLTCDLLFLGDDLLSLRIFDVLRALDMLAVWPGWEATNIRIHASGRQGVAGRLAALLDERITAVTVADGPDSWAKWTTTRHYDTTGIYETILFGGLRYLDLPPAGDIR